MKRELFDKKYKDKFFTKIRREDFTMDNHIYNFIKWCYIHDFLDNLPEKDIKWFLENPGINLPLFENYHITIGIEVWDGRDAYIGIDPSSCFNKLSQCSILVRLPFTSYRAEDEFYSLLEKIFNNDPHIRNWYRDADTMFCGEYYTNMR